MGAQPQTALAIAAVPFGLEAKVEEDLFQMMAGAVQALERDGCRLVGGHSCEAEELSLGEWSQPLWPDMGCRCHE